jgi:hypothetical protein
MGDTLPSTVETTVMEYHQLNTWREIGCRLSYLLRLLGHAAAVLLVASGVAMRDWTLLTAALVTSGVVMLLRRVGQDQLDFFRLRESFPFGCLADLVSPQRRTELVNLIGEFDHPDTDWTRRQEIRNRILALTEQDPRAIRAYYFDLHHILPGLKKPPGNDSEEFG